MKDAALVIVTSNQKKITKQTLDLIYQQTLVPDIVIVDNNSSDGTLDYFKAAFPEAHILKTNKNYGSSGGQYIGCSWAYERGYEFIILSDNDAVPVSNNLIEIIIKNANEAAITQPWNIIADSDNYNQFWSLHYACYHRKIIKKIGYPNFNFFIYADDAEFYLRAEKCCKMVKIKEVSYAHPQKRSCVPARFYFAIRNNLVTFKKHCKFLRKVFELILRENALFIYLYLQEWDFFKFGLKGFGDFLFSKFNNEIINKKSELNAKLRSLTISEFKQKYKGSFVNIEPLLNSILKIENNNFNFRNNCRNGLKKSISNLFTILFCRINIVVQDNFLNPWNIFESFFGKVNIFLDDLKDDVIYYRRYNSGNAIIKIIYLLIMNILFLPLFLLILIKLTLPEKKEEKINSHYLYIEKEI